MSKAQWYYQSDVNNNHEEYKGPVTLYGMKQLYDSGVINDATNVWCVEIDQWSKIKSVSGLKQAIKDATEKKEKEKVEKSSTVASTPGSATTNNATTGVTSVAGMKQGGLVTVALLVVVVVAMLKLL